MISDKSKIKADKYLKVAPAFKLGMLPTEGRHPQTVNLSELSKDNIQEGISVIKKIDLKVVKFLGKKINLLEELRRDIEDTLSGGGRVFFGGCGSTGRLSLTLEALWRESNQGNKAYSDSVMSFMAGGDSAMIKAVEDFEDHPKYGARQLSELGFRDGDLFVGITEGGETPFVIGATKQAVKISKRPPFFMYCNPDDILCSNIKRSAEIINNNGIKKINLFVGPMALSGSTRLQSCTVLMLAAGLALFGVMKDYSISKEISDFHDFLVNTDFGFLEKFILAESEVYRTNGNVMYETRDYGITILTDTTERAPTFSLVPFENQNDRKKLPSLCYLCIPQAKIPEAAWNILFMRAPRVLNWKRLERVVGMKHLMGFDFSNNIKKLRKHLIPDSKHNIFHIFRKNGGLVFILNDVEHSIPVSGLSLLQEHLLLKIVLNTHSTLLMGRLSRYESNIMTWVRPSNNKLIDRTVRYVEYMLEGDGITSFSYEDITYECFSVMETLRDDEPAVLTIYQNLKARLNKSGK